MRRVLPALFAAASVAALTAGANSASAQQNFQDQQLQDELRQLERALGGIEMGQNRSQNQRFVQQPTPQEWQQAQRQYHPWFGEQLYRPEARHRMEAQQGVAMGQQQFQDQRASGYLNRGPQAMGSDYGQSARRMQQPGDVIILRQRGQAGGAETARGGQRPQGLMTQQTGPDETGFVHVFLDTVPPTYIVADVNRDGDLEVGDFQLVKVFQVTPQGRPVELTEWRAVLVPEASIQPQQTSARQQMPRKDQIGAMDQRESADKGFLSPQEAAGQKEYWSGADIRQNGQDVGSAAAQEDVVTTRQVLGIPKSVEGDAEGQEQQQTQQAAGDEQQAPTDTVEQPPAAAKGEQQPATANGEQQQAE